MKAIKLKDGETCLLTFTHVRGMPASYAIARNPLTGDWLQTHKIGDDQAYYYSGKVDAVKLANNILRISTAKNLPCTVEIKPATICV